MFLFFSKLKDESKLSRFLFPFEIHFIYIFLKIDICAFFRRKIPFGSQYLLFCELLLEGISPCQWKTSIKFCLTFQKWRKYCPCCRIYSVLKWLRSAAKEWQRTEAAMSFNLILQGFFSLILVSWTNFRKYQYLHYSLLILAPCAFYKLSVIMFDSKHLKRIITLKHHKFLIDMSF